MIYSPFPSAPFASPQVQTVSFLSTWIFRMKSFARCSHLSFPVLVIDRIFCVFSGIFCFRKCNWSGKMLMLFLYFWQMSIDAICRRDYFFSSLSSFAYVCRRVAVTLCEGRKWMGRNTKCGCCFVLLFCRRSCDRFPTENIFFFLFVLGGRQVTSDDWLLLLHVCLTKYRFSISLSFRFFCHRLILLFVSAKCLTHNRSFSGSLSFTLPYVRNLQFAQCPRHITDSTRRTDAKFYETRKYGSDKMSWLNYNVSDEVASCKWDVDDCQRPTNSLSPDQSMNFCMSDVSLFVETFAGALGKTAHMAVSVILILYE